jgi:hypothetical protein
MNGKNLFCRELSIDSKLLIIPRTTYQREMNEDRVHKIAAEFDERIANEPKVSCRNGRYYVFDGQHTIAARKLLNGGRDLPIWCKVFYGLTESDEALLFAQQTGASANLTAGAKFRALIYGGDEDAMAFLKATESVGLCVDCKQTRGVKRLACIATAFGLYKKVGEGVYREAMRIIVDAWCGAPDSLRAETVQGVVEFVDLYHGEYSRKRLVTKLRQVDPVVIFREGRAMTSLPGYKRYLYQVYRIYNGSSAKTALPMKF